MKKILLLTCIYLISFNNAQAQLPDGSIGADFTVTDLNGGSHNLYTYLDQGYTVFIDFSATWCGPCWGYHISGALEDLYMNHGPTGMANVSATTTDDVMVFFIEGDGGTLAELQGGGTSQGDWITGTPYPIIPTYTGTNSTQVVSDYEIGYWPTVYMICSDRITTEIGSSSNPYSLVDCPAPASNDNDARTFDYSGETLTCEGDLNPEIMIQNYGIVTLTSLSIEVSVNQTLVSTTPWAGSLTTYATTNITLPTLTGLGMNDVVSINVTYPNGVTDADPSNNPTISFNVEIATQNTDTEVTVEIVTDAYGSETTWDIKNASGTVVLSGGPYNNLTAAGVTAQSLATETLSSLTCHTFTIYDSYGDGMDAGYGNGYFTVKDANGMILASGGQFTDEDDAAFKTGNATTTGISDLGSGLTIYPNPTKDLLTIEGIYNSVDILDIFGKVVLSSEYSKNINVSSLANGVYILNINTEKGITTQDITITK